MTNRLMMWISYSSFALALLLTALGLVGAEAGEAFFRRTLRNGSHGDAARYRDLKYSEGLWYGSTFFTGPDWTRVGKDWQHPGQGTALAASPRGPWRFVVDTDISGDVRLAWYGRDGANTDADVCCVPFHGTWEKGWLNVDRLLAEESRLAPLREHLAVDSTDEGIPLALRAMVQVDWRRQDSIDGSAKSFLQSAQQQQENTEELLQRLQAAHGKLFLADESQQLAELAQQLAVNEIDVANGRRVWLEARRLKRRIALANPLLSFGPLLVCKRVPPSWSHLVAQYFGWRQRAGVGHSAASNRGLRF
jgi:hypothetical protein